jgi:hypothetical protein
MSTIINTRSPFYKKISNASLFSAKLELSIWTGETSDKTSADKKYTLKKQAIGSNTYVTFELSKLIRDYMITEYNNYATDTLWIETVVVIYNSSGGTVSTTTENYLAIDGYGYFEDGINPRTTTTPMILQENTDVYYYDGQDIKIPVFAEAATITVSLDSSAGADINWEAADDFWDAYDGTWGSGDTDIDIIDDGNTNQKIQYVIIDDTDTLIDGDTVSFSSVKDSGTTTATTTDKLVDGTQNFTSTVRVGDLVKNTTDDTTATVTAVDSDTTLSLSADIMVSGEAYEIKYEADKVITLKKVNECKFTPLNIIFYNKYGALQNMWFFKKSTTNINITSETFRNNIIDFDNSGGSPTYSLSKHQEKKFIANGKESITINTGFYPEDHNEIVRQMMLAEQVWVYDGTNTLPINLKSNSLQFKKSVNDKLISYTVQFDYAFDKINNIQ